MSLGAGSLDSDANVTPTTKSQVPRYEVIDHPSVREPGPVGAGRLSSPYFSRWGLGVRSGVVP